MTRIRVLMVLGLTLSGVLCDVSQAKNSKQTPKPVEWKKLEKKSTHEKRDSSDLTGLYGVKQKEEPFRPLYQYHYQGIPLRGTSTRYVTAATTPQLSYSKPDAVIGFGGGSSGGNAGEVSTATPIANVGIQYATTSSYKPEGGIQYAAGAYKSSSNSGGGIQYASTAYRGPFITTYQPASAAQVKVHPETIYGSPSPLPAHQPAAVNLPLHYGGFEQPLPPQHHQQNQYAIAIPADYVRHYQQNLAAPFPLHGAHIVPLVYAAAPTASPPPLPALKDQPFKPSHVHYISLAPQSATPVAAASSPATGPMVITQFIPIYGDGSEHQQQFQQQSPAPFYFGNHHQQGPTTFAFTALPHQQQTIQITPKHHIFGPIQMTAVGAAAAATVPIIPFKQIVAAQQQQQQQQLQQPLHHFHHPSTASYARYSQSLSGVSGPGGGGSNPIEVPASETSSSSSAHKLGPLYSSSSSTSSGNIYAGGTGGGSGSGKMSYTYAPEQNSIAPMYTHPGAMYYGTHLYHSPTKVIEIGSNRVTAGSAAVAGVAPPTYHPQQQSAAGNSHGAGGSSSPVAKFP